MNTMFSAALFAAVASAVALGASDPPKSQTTPAAAKAATVIQVTEATFKAEVLDSELPVVIDMYADWCGPCRTFAPTFEATANDYVDKVKFARVNVDKAAKISRLFSVNSIPAIVVVKKNDAGQLVFYKIVGAIDQASLKKFIDDAVKGTTAGTPLPQWK